MVKLKHTKTKVEMEEENANRARAKHRVCWAKQSADAASRILTLHKTDPNANKAPRKQLTTKAPRKALTKCCANYALIALREIR